MNGAKALALGCGLGMEVRAGPPVPQPFQRFGSPVLSRGIRGTVFNIPQTDLFAA
jgi:hypothetical protein